MGLSFQVDETGDLAALATMLDAASALANTGALLVLTSEANRYPVDGLVALLRRQCLPVAGGVFPALIAGSNKLSTGAIVLALPKGTDVFVLTGLGKQRDELDERIAKLAPSPCMHKTMLVLVDGLSRGTGALVDALFNHFGLELNFIGGGAGSSTLQPGPCVLSNEGVLEDAAVLVLSEVVSSIGVAHGLHKVAGPYLVTESEPGRVLSLEWRPAFDVYRQALATVGLHPITADQVAAVSSAYGFGIAKLDAEVVAREPVAVDEDGALICVGDVPAGSFVHLLSSEPDRLLEAAGVAARVAASSYPVPGGQQLGLLIDCVGRSAFLGERFNEELAKLSQGPLPTIGALTVGEIANRGRDYLEFHNKTTVYGVLGG